MDVLQPRRSDAAGNGRRLDRAALPLAEVFGNGFFGNADRTSAESGTRMAKLTGGAQRVDEGR
jgi:hypothetical protein